MFLLHLRRIIIRKDKWYGEPLNSAVLLGTIIIGVVSGLVLGLSSNIYNFYFTYMNVVGTTALNSIGYVFFVLTASYRAFRMKSTESTLLFIACVIAAIGSVSLGGILFPPIVPLKNWLTEVPTKAGSAGIIIAAAFGEVLLGLRTMIGKERGALVAPE